jgi:hypothetical protein
VIVKLFEYLNLGVPASWSGVVTPMTAPNEIKTVADAKSAFNKLN